MGDTGTLLVVLGAVAIVVGVAVLARVPRRLRWPQLLVGVGVVLLLVGLLVRSSKPQPDPCASDDPHTCAQDTSNGP